MDEYNDLLCLMCNELFDDEGDKLPRMLPQCGHSVCSQCIADRLAQHQDILCPEDQYDLGGLKQKAWSLSAGLASSTTTVNTENDRNSELNYTPTGQTHSEESERSSHTHVSTFDEKICQDHYKRLDIVCVDCRLKICANCALFGKHKGHLVRSEEDVLKEITSRAEDLLVMFESVEEKQYYLTDETHIQTVKDYIQSNLKNVDQEIQNKFEEAQAKLEAKKEESLREVKERFQEMEQKCIQVLREAPRDAIQQTEKWKIDAKEKLLVLCEHNNSDNYSLDLMIDERLGNQNDIIVKGKELLKCIELANQDLEKQLEEFQFETVYVDFAPNFHSFFDKIISVSSRQDNELSNLLHTKKNILFSQPFTQSELSLARQSIDVFHEKIDRKNSEVVGFPFIKIGGSFKDGPGDSQILNGEIKHDGMDSSPHQKHKYNKSNLRNLSSGRNSMNNVNGSSKKSIGQSNLINNHELMDDNLLNDDLNDQFSDSVFMMIKNCSKFQSPDYFGKAPNEEYQDNNSLVRSHLSEPQLLDGIEQELFYNKSGEQQGNMDSQVKAFTEMAYATNRSNSSAELKEEHSNNTSKEKLAALLSDQPNNIVKTRLSMSTLQDKFRFVLQDIKKNTIEDADFTYADLGDDGIGLVCDAIRGNTSLKSLKLQRNKISDKGSISILEAIFESDSHVSTLYLQDNMITEKFLENLQSICGKQREKKLEHIYLKNNLLNVNKSQLILQELKKFSINIYL